MPRPAAITVAVLAFAHAAAAQSGAEVVAKRCTGCHNGRSPAGGLDLSTRPSALRGGSRGPAVKPGDAAASPLVARVMAGEMPPQAPLPGAEREALRQWVDAGAVFNGAMERGRAGLDWWSLQPLRETPPPAGAGSPVDRFVQAALRSNGLRPAVRANARALIRRLYFDLTGLPPSPAEIQAFAQDPSPAAWRRLVEQLLASPHYGERWARHWLDAVRFAESEGFERDWLRDHAWPYRDYVVRAFNNDMSYLRFAREQIAGDVLGPVSRDSIAATGFLVAGPTDAVGLTSAVAAERDLIKQDMMEELVGTVSQTFLGLTVNCARCHDHKFDPVTQQDYYRFRAVFDGVRQPYKDVDLKAHGRPLETPAERSARLARREPLEKEIAALEEELGRMDRAGRDFGRVVKPRAQWTFDTDARDDFGAMHLELAGEAQLTEGRLRNQGKETVTLASKPLESSIREKTLEVWVTPRVAWKSGAAVFRIRNREGFRGAATDGIQLSGKEKQWQNSSTAGFRNWDVGGPADDAAPGQPVQVAITYASDGVIRVYRNGVPYGKPFVPDPALASAQLQTYAAGDAVVELAVTPEFDIDEARLYDSPLGAAQVEGSYRAGVRSARPAAAGAELRARLERLRAELKELPLPELVFAAETFQPEPARLLKRGDVTQPAAVVSPGGLSCLPGAELGLDAQAQEGERRARLAQWIAHERNPLFARVMANRVWHHHFGAGLVENPNDFGYNGGKPSHPELLDWLAAGFIRSGWSVKWLHRAIVLSDTYQQSSALQEEANASDANNRWLWRWAPRRLDAESVRDAMLAVSGSLNPNLGGPSFRAFEVKFTGSYQNYTPVDREDPAFNRRTVYRMNVNSGGHPMLESLDCPVPAVKTPKRAATTTALQTLSLMNNHLVARLARNFAARVEREAGTDAEARITRAFELALGRVPTAAEREASVALAARHGLEQLCWGLFNTSEFLYAD
ncbi:MAG: DUF1553 domain-containing protein [Acidobacteria bacterium]|nr:DUF1553 domain-containing protein [Acidobacteriota bacterium]